MLITWLNKNKMVMMLRLRPGAGFGNLAGEVEAGIPPA